ncbi:uncharacterized protein LOC114580210, partial [Dendrobium catenatum]
MEGGESDDDQVMSEVHLGCPPNFSGPYVTHFTFSSPSNKADLIGSKIISLDEDGDLVLARRKDGNNAYRGQNHAYDTGCQSFKLDDDGDLVLSRKRKSCGEFQLSKSNFKPLI